MIQIVKVKEKYNKAEVEICGGAFTKIGTTIENLQFAVEGELFENKKLYPEFAKIAKQEWFPDLVARILSIAKAEAHHAERYAKLLKELKAKTLQKKSKNVEWMCTKCGYVHIWKTPPKICPSCGHDHTYYVLKTESY